EHLHMQGMVKPLVANRCHAMPRGEDQIEEIVTAEYLAQPTFVFDLDPVAKAHEMAEDAGKVAWPAASKAASTALPSTIPKSNRSALHSVCIGAFFESSRSRSRKTTFADSQPRCA